MKLYPNSGLGAFSGHKCTSLDALPIMPVSLTGKIPLWNNGIINLL